MRCGQRCDLPYGHQDHCLDGCSTPPSLACPRTGLTPASAAVVSGCASEMGGIPPAHVDPDVKITQFVSRRRKERRRQEEGKGKADGEVGTEGEGNRKRRKGKGKSCAEGNGKRCNDGPPNNWVPKAPCPYELHRRLEEGKRLEREAAQKADEDSEGEQEIDFFTDRCYALRQRHEDGANSQFARIAEGINVAFCKFALAREDRWGAYMRGEGKSCG